MIEFCFVLANTFNYKQIFVFFFGGWKICHKFDFKLF